MTNIDPCSSFMFQSTLPGQGATQRPAIYLGNHGEFQSTLPAKGATTLGVWLDG